MTLRTSIVPVRWEDDGLRILDQRRLPRDEYYLACRRVEEVAAGATSPEVSKFLEAWQLQERGTDD
ncbi:MAG: translation initiation factor IF-2B subunit alpha [bacterium ADurb.Bin429]|nr:MAG: translation initiation factor IF-2B subunit alpha [bacterium ADurb.Bin429]